MNKISERAEKAIKELLENFAVELIDELDMMMTTNYPEYNDGLKTAQKIIWNLKKQYEKDE